MCIIKIYFLKIIEMHKDTYMNANKNNFLRVKQEKDNNP